MAPTLKPGTYPSMKIQEGSRGTKDPANKNWGRTFGEDICGECVHFAGNGKPCVRREGVQRSDYRCIKDFTRKTRG